MQLVKYLLNRNIKNYEGLKEYEIISLLHNDVSLEKFNKHPLYNTICKKVQCHKDETAKVLSSILLTPIIKIINSYQLF
jgi:hypothetical protein